MNKKAYNKVKYFFKSCPDFKKKNKYSNVHYLIVENGMSGEQIIMFDSKSSLNDFVKKSNKRILDTGKFKYSIDLQHTELEKNIYLEFLDEIIDLFDLIENCQLINKTEYHWKYRTYNFNWRCLIIYAREELEKYKAENPTPFGLEFNSIESYHKDQRIKDGITNLKLIENTLLQIEKTIKETNFREKEIGLDLVFAPIEGLKIEKLEIINKILNYRHPIIYKNFKWKRGIRVGNTRKDRFKVDVKVLSKMPFLNYGGLKRKTPVEAFKDTYPNNENTVFYYQKLGSIFYPIESKYIFPFYKTQNLQFHIQSLLVDLKDEYHYNQTFKSEDIQKYYKRIKFILGQISETKLHLEKILKPFIPFKFDPKFKEFIHEKVDKEKMIFSPWSGYEYHEHELLHCVEEHHKNIEVFIEIFQNVLKKKSPDSIKYNYSQFDTLFNYVDSNFILQMMEELGITKNYKFALNKKKYGSIRGLVESLIKFQVLNESNQIDTINIIAHQIGLRIKKPLNVTDTSEEFKKKGLAYLELNLSEEFKKRIREG